MFKKAFKTLRNSQERNNPSLKDFLQKDNDWLDSYVLFMVIKEQEENRPWSKWPQALEQIRQERKDLLDYQIFL